MTGSEFFQRLRREGRLKLIEPSEELKRAYLKKSESHLASAKILLEHGKLEEAVSMTYYSMYHALTALLRRVGIKCENHAASIILLKEIFGIDNSDITKAKRERIDKQYYLDFRIAREDVVELIRIAESFNSRILDFTERLTSEKILRFRTRAKEVLEGK